MAHFDRYWNLRTLSAAWQYVFQYDIIGSLQQLSQWREPLLKIANIQIMTRCCVLPSSAPHRASWYLYNLCKYSTVFLKSVFLDWFWLTLLRLILANVLHWVCAGTDATSDGASRTSTSNRWCNAGTRRNSRHKTMCLLSYSQACLRILQRPHTL